MFFRHFPDDTVPVDTCIANEDIDSAPLCYDFIDHLLSICEVGNVRLDSQAFSSHVVDLLSDGFGFIGVFAVVERYIGAVFSQIEADSRADSQRTAGHYSVFTF